MQCNTCICADDMKQVSSDLYKHSGISKIK